MLFPNQQLTTIDFDVKSVALCRALSRGEAGRGDWGYDGIQVYAVVDIFSLLTAAAGWYYMFYSRAAQKLGAVEEARINARRVLLRRAGGGVMLLLGVLFFAGFQEGLANATFLGIWLGVLVLLAVIVVLALYDVRLTWKLHKDRQNPPQ